jgi:GAF domain-containing protein
VVICPVGSSTPAYTDLLALELDQLQYTTGEGPALELTTVPNLPYVAVPDLAAHPAWCVFGPAAVELGAHALLALGLFAEGTEVGRPRMGSLNLYAHQPHVFDEGTQEVALILAVHAAVALADTTAVSTAQEQIAYLRQALSSRDVIGQAKGILMERYKLTDEQAFDALRQSSNQLNIKLHDLAARLAKTGEEPLAGHDR